MDEGALDLRPYREGDEEAILRVLNETAGILCSLDQWAWLFPAEANGRAIVVGERDNDIVAVCAGSPVRFAVDGSERVAVELRALASRNRGDLDRVLDYFVKTFASTDRFALALAPFDFDGAAQAPITALVRERVESVNPRAGHPSMRHHRFLVFPRYSRSAVAFAVFANDGSNCCWLDLLWDHQHPGALDLLAHISGRLIAQWVVSGERLWLAGDDAASSLLVGLGFRPQTSSPPVASMRSFTPDLDASEIVGRAYLTVADVGGLGS
jgi:hypothetical protein